MWVRPGTLRSRRGDPRYQRDRARYRRYRGSLRAARGSIRRGTGRSRRPEAPDRRASVQCSAYEGPVFSWQRTSANLRAAFPRVGDQPVFRERVLGPDGTELGHAGTEGPHEGTGPSHASTARSPDVTPPGMRGRRPRCRRVLAPMEEPRPSHDLTLDELRQRVEEAEKLLRVARQLASRRAAQSRAVHAREGPHRLALQGGERALPSPARAAARPGRDARRRRGRGRRRRRAGQP